MATGPVLELKNISMKAADAELGVIRSMNLSLPPGEAVVVFHMQRWERRTLIDLISALAVPHEGEVYFKGAALEGVREIELNSLRGRIGIVTDPPVFLNNVRIMENLRLSMRYHKDMKRRAMDERLSGVLHDVGLDRIPDVIPSLLDPSTLGAAALARALCTSPDLLILERPEENLGRRLVAKLPQLWVKYIFKNGGAVLVMTGVARLAQALSDRIAVFEHGCVSSIENRESFRLMREGMTTDWSNVEEDRES